MTYRICLSSDQSSETLSHHLASKLDEAGIQVTATSPDAYLYLGDLTDETAHALNAHAFAEMCDLVAIALSESMLRVGPVVVYGQSPCLACWREHHKLFPYNGYDGVPPAFEAIPKQITDGTMSQITHALLEYASQRSGILRPGTITYFASPSGQFVRRVRMVRSPLCPVCSALAEHAAESYRSYVS